MLALVLDVCYTLLSAVLCVIHKHRNGGEVCVCVPPYTADRKKAIKLNLCSVSCNADAKTTKPLR